MSRLIDAQQVFNETNLTTQKSVILDLGECDRLSVGITVSAATGSNLLDLYESVNGIDFVPVASLIITMTGTTIWHVHPVFSRWKKILYVPGSGSASFTVDINVRNDSLSGQGDSVPMTPGVS